MVNHEFYDDVIKWSDDGNYVIITSEGRFEDKVLIEPRDRIFKTTSMKSFIRQLNLYGFHKVQLDKDKNFSHLNVKDKANWPETVFAHASFKRSRQDLLGKKVLFALLLGVLFCKICYTLSGKSLPRINEQVQKLRDIFLVTKKLQKS